MNANAPVLRFSCARDEYGEAIAQEKDWLSAVRPLGYRNLQSFLERRRAPKHRKHIDRLLQEYGCQDLEGFLRVTHAVSLNDTYWVKAEESGQTWADVSLYTNDFDEIVAEAALNGNFSRESFSSTSPEFGTDGRYAKCSGIVGGKCIRIHKRHWEIFYSSIVLFFYIYNAFLWIFTSKKRAERF